MDNYTHVAMCRVSAYICVYMVPVQCEKYSVKSEILAKTRNLPIYYHITFFRGIFVTMPMDRYAHMAIYRLLAYIGIHMAAVNSENIV